MLYRSASSSLIRISQIIALGDQYLESAWCNGDIYVEDCEFLNVAIVIVSYSTTDV